MSVKYVHGTGSTDREKTISDVYEACNKVSESIVHGIGAIHILIDGQDSATATATNFIQSPNCVNIQHIEIKPPSKNETHEAEAGATLAQPTVPKSYKSISETKIVLLLLTILALLLAAVVLLLAAVLLLLAAVVLLSDVTKIILYHMWQYDTGNAFNITVKGTIPHFTSSSLSKYILNVLKNFESKDTEMST